MWEVERMFSCINTNLREAWSRVQLRESSINLTDKTGSKRGIHEEVERAGLNSLTFSLRPREMNPVSVLVIL